MLPEQYENFNQLCNNNKYSCFIQNYLFNKTILVSKIYTTPGWVLVQVIIQINRIKVNLMI